MLDAGDSTEEWGKLAYWMRNAAFEQCPEPLMLLDPIANQYVDCNVAACNLIGYARQDLLKMPITAIHGRELGQLIVFTEQAMAQGRAKSDRISCRLSNDEHIAVELSGARAVIKRREYLVVVLRDISSEERFRDKA
jgi:PAS domain S-box-containing protein